HDFTLRLTVPFLRRLARHLPKGDPGILPDIEALQLSTKHRDAFLDSYQAGAADKMREAARAASTERVATTRKVLIDALRRPVEMGIHLSAPRGNGDGVAATIRPWTAPTGQIAPHTAPIEAHASALLDAFRAGAYVAAQATALTDLARAAADNLARLRDGEGEERAPATTGDRSDGVFIHGDEYLSFREWIVQREEQAVAGLAWASDAVAWLAALSPRSRAAYLAFGRAIEELPTGPKPTARWLRDARAALDDSVAELLPDRLGRYRPRAVGVYGANTLLGQEQERMRALAWAASLLPPEKVGDPLRDLAQRAIAETADGITTAEPLALACIWSLEALPDGAGAERLASLLSVTRPKGLRRRVAAALARSEREARSSPARLAELAAPNHGFGTDDVLWLPAGAGSAKLSLGSSGRLSLAWQHGDGPPRRSLPAEIQEADPTAVRAIRARVREVEAEISVQRDRLEGLYLQNHSIPADDWTQLYRDHGTVGLLARRLLWTVATATGRTTFLPRAGTLEDLTGSPVELGGGAVSLWHPLEAEEAEVAAWRTRLARLEVTQPFNQVWREIFRASGAQPSLPQVAGRRLSLRQVRLLAPRLGWSDPDAALVAEPPMLHLPVPAHDLFVGLALAGPSEGDRLPRLTAGPLTIRQAGDDHPTPHERVPPIVLSEVFRHLERFSHRPPSSPDSDTDGGSEIPPIRTALTLTRHSVLSQILPPIDAGEDRLRLEVRHLCVRGERRRYRIDLATAAVAREPDGQHVAVLRGLTRSDRAYLPFEDDPVLSLILSKALILARDDTITDPVFLSQI
ncbi:MAG: DUF4132 domain-containing protein, partial [Pseudomonadota bacterium]